MSKIFSIVSGFLLMALVFTGLAQAQEQQLSAHQVVEKAANELFDDLEANRALYRAEPEAFYAAMNRLVGSYVDVGGIARSVMTVRFSRNASEEQMQRFQENFKRSLMQFYGNALLEYDNRGVRVLPAQPANNPNRAEVRMEVSDSKGIIYPVSYTMVKLDGSWKLRNVVIEGINIGMLFRDQFTEAMRRNRNDLDVVIDTWVDTVASARQAEEQQ